MRWRRARGGAAAALRLAAWCAAAALLATPAAAARRTDQDFEFDDDADAAPRAVAAAPRAVAAAPRAAEGAALSRRPRLYTYDPHNALCLSLRCRPRELCVLRDALTALCASRQALLRSGDTIVTAAAGAGVTGGEATRDDEDDVFYDADAERGEGDADLEADAARRDRCVGCGSVPRAQFLCGSDNRTYSSLCRLDLHNCVRRGRAGAGAGALPAAVVAACRGFCPCRRRRGPRYHHYDDDELRPAAAWREREQDSAHNEVLPPEPPPPPPPALHPPRAHPRRAPHTGGPRRASHTDDVPRMSVSAECALGQLADRLLDWFSVLMDEAGGAPPAPARAPRLRARPSSDGAGAVFPRACKPEVRWMFAHLDTDGDGLLSDDNLYSLRHDDREQCLRPFLESCVGAGAGAGAGAGRGVSRAAWCACLRRAARPCTALARAHPAPHAGGAYVPACDARGFYRARQCHRALGVCWCVTPHGAERPGSRTRGATRCPGESATTTERAGEAAEGGEGEGAPADDEDAAGSGDAELRF